MNDLAQEWFVTKDVSDRTMLGYQEVWKNLIAPTWSSVKLENVKPDGGYKVDYNSESRTLSRASAQGIHSL